MPNPAFLLLLLLKSVSTFPSRSAFSLCFPPPQMHSPYSLFLLSILLFLFSSFPSSSYNFLHLPKHLFFHSSVRPSHSTLSLICSSTHMCNRLSRLQASHNRKEEKVTNECTIHVRILRMLSFGVAIFMSSH